MIVIEKETEHVLDFPYEEVIRKVIGAALDYVDCPYETTVNVLLTDNATIQEYNREHRDIDRPTDVLSFPMIDYETAGDFSGLEDDADSYFDFETGELIYGDIIISLDKVKEQALEYGHSETRELAFLVAHSMLHLTGYDHMEDDERLEMERMQEEILAGLGIGR